MRGRSELLDLCWNDSGDADWGVWICCACDIDSQASTAFGCYYYPVLGGFILNAVTDNVEAVNDQADS